MIAWARHHLRFHEFTCLYLDSLINREERLGAIHRLI
jgi:hypothetical protein